MPAKNLSLKKITIDAEHQSLGRLASRVAYLVRAKDLPIWLPNKVIRREVEVINLSQIKFSPRKLAEVSYRHSGYPGGLKTETLETRWKKSPERVFRLMIQRMLPANRLRKHYLKNLHIAN